MAFAEMKWGPTVTLTDGRQQRTGEADEEFWVAWRRDKNVMKESGFSVTKSEDGKWLVTQTLELSVAQREERLQASRARAADLDIPVPEGLAYLPFQRAGIAYALDRPATLMGDEMGLGKTIQAIGVLNATQPDTVLVICPASLKLNWRNELGRWLVKGRRIDIVNGGGQQIPADPDVVIINYDVLGKHSEALQGRTWGCVVMDEAHYCKNPKAKRTKAALAIQAERKLLLTGTPFINRPVELQPLAGYLAPDVFGDFWQYVHRYCNAFHGRWGWDFTGSGNLDELQEKLRRSIMVRRQKAEVLEDLPPKVRQVIVLDAADYANELKLETLAEADVETEKPELRFEQLSKVRHATALAKVPALLDHLLALEDEVVVMAHHRDVVAALAEGLRAKGNAVVTLTGEDSTVERDRAVQCFQAGSARYFVGTIKAAGVGLTLTQSSHVVFAELDWVPGNLSQAEDRCHRIGQRDSVLVQHLVVDGSIDARMVELVVEKQAVLDAGLDDEVVPVAPAAQATGRDVGRLDEPMSFEKEAELLDWMVGNFEAKPQRETIDLTALVQAFSEATSPQLKRPALTVGSLHVKAAPATGRNPGCLYVTRGSEYQGKVLADGTWQPMRGADVETDEELLALAEGPLEAARAHGIATGVCGCCGRELTNPESIAAGIGPICAERWA
jgi:hypothetical protein